MVGIWRETGAHLVSCITPVYFVTVAYKFDHRYSMPKVYLCTQLQVRPKTVAEKIVVTSFTLVSWTR